MVVAVLWLISLLINCLLWATRKNFLQWILTFLITFIALPVILFILENMLGVLVLLIIMKVLATLFPKGKSYDETKVKLYDENGNLIGVVDREDIDKNFKDGGIA